MIIVLQILSAMTLGIVCYLIAVAMTVYDGLPSAIFQTLMGWFFSATAVAILSLVGLPIRIVPALNRIWKKYWWVSLVLAGIAVGMMISAWLPECRVKVFDPVLEHEVDSFNPGLAIGGWCLLLFAVLHFYPPISPCPRRNKTEHDDTLDTQPQERRNCHTHLD